jgi:hypothetical protein
MHLLHTSPAARVAFRCREARAQFRPPLRFVSGVEGAGLEGAQRVAAHALVVFEDETQVGFECEIGTNVDAAKRVRVLLIEGLAVLTMVSRLQADVIRVRLVTGSCGTYSGNRA